MHHFKPLQKEALHDLIQLKMALSSSTMVLEVEHSLFNKWGVDLRW